MKNHYKKPMACVVPLRVNENIATSGLSSDESIEQFEVRYSYSSDGSKKFIAFSNILATSTGSPLFDLVMDKFLVRSNGLYNCSNISPGGSGVMPI